MSAATPRIGESCADHRVDELALKPSRSLPRWLRIEVRHQFLRVVVNPPRSNYGPWLAWRQASLDECDIHAVGNTPMLGVGGCAFEITDAEATKIIAAFGLRDARESSTDPRVKP